MLRNGFIKNAAQNASSAMLASNETVAMPICYCKQKLATLAPPLGASDWFTVLELILMSSVGGKALQVTQVM